jgi:hypothetical protein
LSYIYNLIKRICFCCKNPTLDETIEVDLRRNQILENVSEEPSLILSLIDFDSLCTSLIDNFPTKLQRLNAIQEGFLPSDLLDGVLVVGAAIGD